VARGEKAFEVQVHQVRDALEVLVHGLPQASRADADRRRVSPNASMARRLTTRARNTPPGCGAAWLSAPVTQARRARVTDTQRAPPWRVELLERSIGAPWLAARNASASSRRHHLRRVPSSSR
jgi:hypothetical protein